MRVFGVTGWKNAGKTGLMERLVAEFTRRGLRVSTIKHAHHDTDVDQPGRDSHRHREAGATEVLLASPRRWALMHELRDAPEPPLADLIPKLAPVDLVLIEGYKQAPHGKVEAWRAETGKPPLATRNYTIRFIASDGPVPDASVPVVDLNDTAAVADAIAAQVGLPDRHSTPHATAFDRVIMVDWSAAAKPTGAEPQADAIWIAETSGRAPVCSYHRTRHAAMTHLRDRLSRGVEAGDRVLVGFDFPFAYPRGFARAVTGGDDPLGLWAELAAQITDDAQNANNRFDVAEALNRRFPGCGPFWGCPKDRATADLPAKGTDRTGHGMPERRAVEEPLRGSAQPCWKLYTTGSVGSQALMGVHHLQALREDPALGAHLRVAPFQRLDGQIVLAEVFPSLIAQTVQALRHPGEIKDCAQVRVLAQAIWNMGPDRLDQLLREGDAEEGWILGVGHEDELAQAAHRGFRA